MSDFLNHSSYYRLNWSPLSPVTICTPLGSITITNDGDNNNDNDSDNNNDDEYRYKS